MSVGDIYLFLYFFASWECVIVCISVLEWPWGSEEEVRSLGARVRGSCEPPDVGTRIQTLLLPKSGRCSLPLSLLSILFRCYFFIFTCTWFWSPLLFHLLLSPCLSQSFPSIPSFIFMSHLFFCPTYSCPFPPFWLLSVLQAGLELTV